MSEQLIRANQQAAETISALSEIFSPRTAGVLAHKLDQWQRQAGQRFGMVGTAFVVAGRLALAIAVLGLMLAGLFWCTLGSLVVMLAGPKLFGYPGTDTSGLPLGLLLGAANAGITLTSLAYLVHVLRPRAERDVYGRAAFADEREQAAAAGLSAFGDRETDHD